MRLFDCTLNTGAFNNETFNTFIKVQDSSSSVYRWNTLNTKSGVDRRTIEVLNIKYIIFLCNIIIYYYYVYLIICILYPSTISYNIIYYK